MASRLFTRRSLSSRACRSGFSLLELLLVVALLVAMLGLAWPALAGLFDGRRLRLAGDELAAACSEACAAAMSSGDIYALQIESGGRSYEVCAWAGELTADMQQLSETASEDADRAAKLNAAQEQARERGEPEPQFERVLPEGVTFARLQQTLDTRASETLLQQPGRANLSQPPLLFYPDGTCSDGVFLLQNERNSFVRVVLRGLTGVSRVSALLSGDDVRGEVQ